MILSLMTSGASLPPSFTMFEFSRNMTTAGAASSADAKYFLCVRFMGDPSDQCPAQER